MSAWPSCTEARNDPATAPAQPAPGLLRFTAAQPWERSPPETEDHRKATVPGEDRSVLQTLSHLAITSPFLTLEKLIKPVCCGHNAHFVADAVSARKLPGARAGWRGGLATAPRTPAAADGNREAWRLSSGGTWEATAISSHSSKRTGEPGVGQRGRHGTEEGPGGPASAPG